MTEYGQCQVQNCQQPAEFLLQFDSQPQNPLRCCRDCYSYLASPVDTATRL